MSARAKMKATLLATTLTALLATAAPALAQDGDIATSDVAASPTAGAVRVDRPHHGARPLVLDVHAGALYFGPALAAGFRVNIPLVSNGFLPNLNNAIYLSVGADLYWGRYVDQGVKERGVGFGVPVAFHWEFYFTETLSAFAEVGLNIYFPPAWVGGGDLVDDAAGWFLAQVGGRWMFAEHAGLVVRLGTPYTVVGLALSF